MKEKFDGKKVLITGGLGFIGSNLALRLAAMGARVMLVDSLIEEFGGNLFNIDGFQEKVRVNIADIRDEHGMAYLVRGQDYLFNLAGQTSHMDSMRDPYTDLEINCRSQLSILEACRKNNPTIRIVFASTRQLYGKPIYLPVDEKHPVQPVDVNGINKLSGEWYHTLYNNIYGISSCSLRLTNTYGPRMRVKDARQTFLGWWIRLLLEGREIEVFGDGQQLRDFNYIDDAVDAFLLAAVNEHARGKIYNLGSDERTSLGDLAALMVKINAGGHYKLIPFPAERKAIDIGDYYSDFALAERELGWRPRMSLTSGLTATLGYFKTWLPKYV